VTGSIKGSASTLVKAAPAIRLAISGFDPLTAGVTRLNAQGVQADYTDKAAQYFETLYFTTTGLTTALLSKDAEIGSHWGKHSPAAAIQTMRSQEKLMVIDKLFELIFDS
jgi:hypothetical protein